jgi:hypothetical protein
VLQTADWAFIVSLCSVAIALFSLLWNIWSKFIYPKPTVRAGFSYMVFVGSEEEILTLSATNMGPIPVTLHSAIVRKKSTWLSRMRTYGILLPLHDYPFRKDHTTGPFSGGLPKTVEVGQLFSVYFPPDNEGLARDDYDRIGFSDTFGKYHWASKRDIVRARKFIREACDRVGKSYK